MNALTLSNDVPTLNFDGWQTNNVRLNSRLRPVNAKTCTLVKILTGDHLGSACKVKSL